MTPRAIGLALILVANAFALGGVAWNRAGSPESAVTLTQRELTVSSDMPRSENSGVTLRLSWCLGDSTAVEFLPEEERITGYPIATCFERTPSWLNAAMMRKLGFDTSLDVHDSQAARYYSRRLERPAFYVAELGGAWHERHLSAAQAELARREAELEKAPDSTALKRVVKAARGRFESVQNSATRLYLIDAGSDVAELRAKYADRSRYMILPGTVKATVRRRYDGSDTSASLGGVISSVLSDEINLPAKYKPLPKTFAATIAIGKRLQPWIRTWGQAP